MIELSTHIEYLLLSQQQVKVPQLGTFTAREMSSRRMDEEGIFLPPFRTVSFQWDEQEAGEDFILTLSKLYRLTRSEARILCAEYADELRQILTDEGVATVGSMGQLMLDAETDEIRFVPLQSGIASPAYYGLDALPFAKLSHEQLQQRERRRKARRTRITSFSSDRDTITIRINRRALNYASAVAASVVLFFALSSPVANTIREFGKQHAALTLAPKITASQQTPAAQEQPTVKAEPAKATSAEQSQHVANKDFVIVMASALSEKRAQAYAAQLREQGFDAQPCVIGTMVRVVIPGYATEEEAYSAIRQGKTTCSDFAQAWPYQLKGDIKLIQ